MARARVRLIGTQLKGHVPSCRATDIIAVLVHTILIKLRSNAKHFCNRDPSNTLQLVNRTHYTFRIPLHFLIFPAVNRFIGRMVNGIGTR